MSNFCLNGEPRVLPDPSPSVAELLESLGYAGKRVAVELNGLILPKSQHASIRIAPDDTLEIVVAVGGG